MKDKIRALTRRTSQANPKDALIRLNQIMRGWGSGLPITADGIDLINLSRTLAITRYRYRGDMIPSPWPLA
ncbi:MAG: RNA-directed polymerase [Actinomycetia bacterium]|nr:RNA-directed polymerase [Actinomycetes bacterium]